MNRTKFFLAVTVALIAEFHPASASASAGWQKIISCDSGAAVVDVNDGDRRKLQLVIRNSGILEYLYKSGAIQLSWGQSESALGAYADHGIFNPGDFSSAGVIPNNVYDDRRAYFYRQGSGLKVSFVQKGSCWTEHSPECKEDPYSMQCESEGVTRCNPDREVANWYFQSCN